MDVQTLIDNLMFWSIFIPVIWLVWESNKPQTYFRAYWFLVKQRRAMTAKVKSQPCHQSRSLSN